MPRCMRTGLPDALQSTTSICCPRSIRANNKELDEKIQQLHEAMEAVAQTAVDAEKWVGLMRQYVNPTELTAELLNTLIEKILVHEAVKGEDGSREQEVEIFYRFIGKID